MELKFIQEEDFVNYKKTSFFIGTSMCSFKCEKECGIKCCQNSQLVKSPSKDVSINKIVEMYLSNLFVKAVVIGGMEPFDQFPDLLELVSAFRKQTNDDIVIYTGYYKEEIAQQVELLRQYKNILIKFGRFIPNQSSHFDEVLGVNLASENQYAEKIS